MNCPKCGGTILAPTRTGVPRGTCYCQQVPPLNVVERFDQAYRTFPASSNRVPTGTRKPESENTK